MDTYEKGLVAWFCSSHDEHWELSNMVGGMPIYWPLEKKPENRWNSSEQLYQASKYASDTECVPETTKSVSTPRVRDRIHAQSAARAAKMTQKCAVKAGLVRPDWELVKTHAMLWVVELKLYFNPSTFGRALAETGDNQIVELSRKDDFWGAKETQPNVLIGNNELGKILMDVRSRMQEIKSGKFTYPNGLLLP